LSLENVQLESKTGFKYSNKGRHAFYDLNGKLSKGRQGIRCRRGKI